MSSLYKRTGSFKGDIQKNLVWDTRSANALIRKVCSLSVQRRLFDLGLSTKICLKIKSKEALTIYVEKTNYYELLISVKKIANN